MTFREEHLITEPGDFWKWVDRRCWTGRTTYLVAHNIVFDLNVVGGFKRLADLDWTLDSFYSKSMISIFRWSKDAQNFIDNIEKNNIMSFSKLHQYLMSISILQN